MRRGEFWTLVRRLAAYAVLSAVTFIVCFPLVWALSTSLKPKSEIFATPPTLIPRAATLENYRALLTGRPQYFQSGGQQVDTGTTPAQFFTRWFLNSVIVTLGSTLISITISTLAAYSLTRFRYWGRTFVPYFSLLGYMVPSIIFVFPLFLVMVRLDLTDSLLSLVLGYVCISLPFCMWLMWAFMRSIPIEIEEAALIDGASRLQVFWQVVLPTALPGIIAGVDLFHDRVVERLPVRPCLSQLARQFDADGGRDAVLRGHACRLGTADGGLRADDGADGDPVHGAAAPPGGRLRRRRGKGLTPWTCGSSASTSPSAPHRC